MKTAKKTPTMHGQLRNISEIASRLIGNRHCDRVYISDQARLIKALADKSIEAFPDIMKGGEL